MNLSVFEHRMTNVPRHGSILGQVVHLSRVQKILELPVDPTGVNMQRDDVRKHPSTTSRQQTETHNSNRKITDWAYKNVDLVLTQTSVQSARDKAVDWAAGWDIPKVPLRRNH